MTAELTLAPAPAVATVRQGSLSEPAPVAATVQQQGSPFDVVPCRAYRGRAADHFTYPVESKQFSKIIDKRLEGHYSKQGARKIAKLANSCLAKQRRDRPTMREVVESLKQAMQHNELDGKTGSLGETSPPEEVSGKPATEDVAVASARRRMLHLAALGENANIIVRLSPTVRTQKQEALDVLGRPQLKGYGPKTSLLQQATQTRSRAPPASPHRAAPRRPRARRRGPASHELELATPPASSSPLKAQAAGVLPLFPFLLATGRLNLPVKFTAAAAPPPDSLCLPLRLAPAPAVRVLPFLAHTLVLSPPLALLFSGGSTCSSSMAGLAAVPALPPTSRRTWGPRSRKGGGARGGGAGGGGRGARRWRCRRGGARRRRRGCGDHSSGRVALAGAGERGPPVQISGSGRPLPVVGPAWRHRRTERRRVFGFCLSSNAKWVMGLPPPLERVLSRKNTVYSAFLGLGHVMRLLLESV